MKTSGRSDAGIMGAAAVPTGIFTAGCARHIFTKLFRSGYSTQQVQGSELLWWFPTQPPQAPWTHNLHSSYQERVSRFSSLNGMDEQKQMIKQTLCTHSLFQHPEPSNGHFAQTLMST